MLIMLDKSTRITCDQDGRIHVTRPSITGRVTSHVLDTEYDIFDIARYLHNRMLRVRQDMVQNVFPNMPDQDREFLMTGISPSEWAELFPKEGE